MDKDQIFEMVVRELTENALEIRQENLPEEESDLYAEVVRLSQRLNGILVTFSAEKRKVIEDYMDKKELIADKECLYLYVQGAKDAITLLKKLEMF